MRRDVPFEFYDHSTPIGRATLYCGRVYRTGILSILLLIGSFITIYTYIKASNSPVPLTLTLGASPLPDYEINFSDGRLEVVGEGDLGSLGSDAAFITWPLPADAALTSLEMKNVLIDGPSFTQSLQGHTSLVSLKLESVWITGDFSPVYLPALTSFYLNQYRNEQTDRYKPQHQIKSLLFFEIDATRSWEVNSDLVNLNVKVHLSLGGTTILHIDRKDGKINLNVHNCDQLLSNLSPEPPVTQLTLSWCSITSSHIPKTLTYLNLNNAAPSTQDFEELLTTNHQLEELHAFLPPHLNSHDDIWNNNTELTTIHVSSLPASLKFLSLSNINLIYSKNIQPNINLEELYVENSLDFKFSVGIDNVFPNLKRVGIFSASGESAFNKLLKRLVGACVEWILVEGFDLKGSGKKEIENLLAGFGMVDTTSKDFLIEGCRDNNSQLYTASVLTLYEKNFYRYSLLGFDKVDSYEDYVIWDRESKQ